MSDETPDPGTPNPATPDAATPDAATPDAATPDAATPDPATPDPGTPGPGTTPTRSRPAPTAGPGAAAARRARQLGGPRRPLPQPRPAAPLDPASTASTEPAATSAAAAAPVTAPKSSVGKAAARPRPRPRPRPAASSTDASADPAAPASVGTATVAGDTTDTGTDASTDTDTKPARPRRAGRLFVAGSLTLTVLLLGVGAVFLVLTLTAKPPISARETDRALAAAKTEVALFTSYGYQTVDADAAKAAAGLTGQFKQQYLSSIAEVVKPQLPTTKTVNAGQVDTAGLVSVSPDGDQVVVLVYGQSSVTNVAQTTPRIDAFQLQVTLQRVGGQWLVSQLRQLGSTA